MSELTASDIDTLRRIDVLIVELLNVYPDMSLNQFRAFLAVAIADGCSQEALVSRFDHVSPSAVTRQLQVWEQFAKGKGTGLGYIETDFDPQDTRKRKLNLTSKGFHFARKLAQFISNEPNKSNKIIKEHSADSSTHRNKIIKD